jgi:hypothetical protein
MKASKHSTSAAALLGLGTSPRYGLCILAAALIGGSVADPIRVRINDVPNSPPVIQVKGAPEGFDVYTGDLVADPAIEDGALITLFGVDRAGTIADWAGRFTVPDAPLWFRSAVDIVWVEHDVIGPFGLGDLQIGFNSAHPGTYYFNPELVNPETGELFIPDEDLGPVTDNWVVVYADETVVVEVKPHTYRLRD